MARPGWVPTPEIIEKAEHYASLGLTQQQIADCLGIHISTLCEKKNDFEEFAEAIKRGQAKGIAMVAEKLINNVNLGNVTAQIFFLKCRGGWREEKEADEKQKSVYDLIREKLEHEST